MQTEQIHVMAICGDRWHPAANIRAGLDGFGKGEFVFHWIEDAEAWSAARMAFFRLVLLTKSDNVSSTDERPWMNEKVEEVFIKHVRQGRGLMVVHSGTIYGHRPRLRRLIGGAFTHHPEQEPVTMELQSNHPMTVGATAFTLNDEHYFMEMDDLELDLFLHTASSNGRQPGGWKRREGKGRICVLTPGHNVEVWQHPSFRTLLANGMRWCGRRRTD